GRLVRGLRLARWSNICPDPPIVSGAAGGLGWTAGKVEGADTSERRHSSTLGKSQEPALEERFVPDSGLVALSPTIWSRPALSNDRARARRTCLGSDAVLARGGVCDRGVVARRLLCAFPQPARQLRPR